MMKVRRRSTVAATVVVTGAPRVAGEYSTSCVTS